MIKILCSSFFRKNQQKFKCRRRKPIQNGCRLYHHPMFYKQMKNSNLAKNISLFSGKTKLSLYKNISKVSKAHNNSKIFMITSFCIYRSPPGCQQVRLGTMSKQREKVYQSPHIAYIHKCEKRASSNTT